MSKECFSLIRYSSLKQKDGDSERRQLEIAPRVAKEKGWHLREDLSLQGLGLSAYHGDNLKIIRSIIDGAKNGIISKGTVCILEALDRLTRLNVDDAYQLLREVLMAGVEIYTDKNQRHLTKQSLKEPMAIMMSVVELDAAFEYSDKLSQRVGKAWINKRNKVFDGKERLTKMTVAWVNGKTWKVDEDKADIVRRIYQMYADGYGISHIVKTFNIEGVPNLGEGKKKGKSWNTGYVHALLKSRSVIGEFQQHKTYRIDGQKSYRREKIGLPIENYYPRIIDNPLFYLVQSKIGNVNAYRRTSNIRNLFAGVAFCECGEKMYLAGGKDGNYYYYCRANITAENGIQCKSPSIRYEPIEHLLLITVGRNIEKILPESKYDNSRLIELRGTLEDKRQQVSNITGYVKSGKATIALVEAQMELEKEIAALSIELEIAEVSANAKTFKPAIDILDITIEDLRRNQDVRRFVRDFILTNINEMIFSIDRKTVKFGFTNDRTAKMLSNTVDEIKDLPDKVKTTKTVTKTPKEKIADYNKRKEANKAKD